MTFAMIYIIQFPVPFLVNLPQRAFRPCMALPYIRALSLSHLMLLIFMLISYSPPNWCDLQLLRFDAYSPCSILQNVHNQKICSCRSTVVYVIPKATIYRTPMICGLSLFHLFLSDFPKSSLYPELHHYSHRYPIGSCATERLW